MTGAAVLSAEVILRPATDADVDFLLDLYAATRRGELVPLGWNDAAADSFLRGRFRHEQRDWALHRPGSQALVVECRGRPVGRLQLARTAHEILVMDVSILPEQQRQGIATTLIRALLDEAERTRRTVRMTVDRSSPLARVCRRLGFLPAATRAETLLLEWTAAVPS